MERRDLQRELEGMIDERGLSDVLLALMGVCDAKADHLRTNWQDEATARVWDRAASRAKSFCNFAYDNGLRK